jgi:Ubiquinol-cytochrome C reductase complex 14kD subunit
MIGPIFLVGIASRETPRKSASSTWDFLHVAGARICCVDRTALDGSKIVTLFNLRCIAGRNESRRFFATVSFSCRLPILSPNPRWCAGIRYEDLLNSSKPEVAEALELAAPEYVKGRMRRLKRASDLSFKGKNLGDYSNETLAPFKVELWEDVKKIQARDAEYALLDLYKK